jgi:CRISPR-associated exonuclease Cas4
VVEVANGLLDDLSEERISGVQLNYYFICKRKLYLFSKGITFEKENEDVKIGRLIEQSYYTREKKNRMVDAINIDGINFEDDVLYEVKKSSKNESSDIWQLKYYMFYMKHYKATIISKGVLRYPEEHRNVIVVLTAADEAEILQILAGIRVIIKQSKAPPVIKKRICKACAYHDFCFI